MGNVRDNLDKLACLAVMGVLAGWVVMVKWTEWKYGKGGRK